MNTDDCNADSCKNNGTCIDLVSNFTCECNEGWGGKDCSTDIPECEPNPCLENGLCIENPQPPGFK